MDLIRTSLKEKLPKGYTYPVTAEFVSAALAGVPQFHELSIRFCWRDTYWASEYDVKIRSAGKINVVFVHPTMWSRCSTPRR